MRRGVGVLNEITRVFIYVERTDDVRRSRYVGLETAENQTVKSQTMSLTIHQYLCGFEL